jgi:hypothetical protein
MNRRVSASDRLTIVVLGYIVRGPLGGLVWHHLQYVMGLANLGHDVYFVEDSGESLWCCYDADRHVSDTDPSYGLRFADAAFRMAGVPDRWAYYDAHRDRWHGPAGDRLLAICERADLLIDVSGVNTMRPWFRQIPNRALIDTDPAFTQLRHLSEPAARAEAACHTSFFFVRREHRRRRQIAGRWLSVGADAAAGRARRVARLARSVRWSVHDGDAMGQLSAART